MPCGGFLAEFLFTLLRVESRPDERREALPNQHSSLCSLPIIIFEIEALCP
jgi:hypothetical protein